MAFSYVPYTGDGSTQNYSLPFSYINKTDITVTVNGTAVPFTWNSTSVVRITTAPPAASAIQIKRVTQKTVVPVNFTDGSTLLEGDLDTLVQYVLYVAQEQADFPPDSAVAAAAASGSAAAAASSAAAASAASALVGRPIVQGLTVRDNVGSHTYVDVRAPASGYEANLSFLTGTLARWQISKGAGIESGGNSGSDLVFNRYSDAGAYIDTPMSFSRLNGGMFIGQSGGISLPLTVSGFSTAGTVWTRFVNGSGAANTVALSLDPGNNGIDTRDASIRAYNNGGNQIQLSFYLANGATPVETLRLLPTGEVLAVGAAAGLGYGTGSGGVVRQLTSKSTGVTLNKATGQINTSYASLAAGASVQFILTNSVMAGGTNVVVINVDPSTTNFNQYEVRCYPADGAAIISIKNISAGTLTDEVILKYAIIKAATA